MNWDRSQSMVYRTFLACAVATIPYFLFSNIMGVIDCNTLDNNALANSTWHQNHPQGTLADYKKNCNDTISSMKPVSEVMEYGGAVLLGSVAWVGLYKEWKAGQASRAQDKPKGNSNDFRSPIN